MPITNIRSEWVSGNLVFYEDAVGQSTTGDVLRIGTGAVTVGEASQDVDFKVFLGASDQYVLFDAGAATVTFAKVDVAINGDLTIDLEDIQIGDNNYLMFGDDAAGDVSMRWVSATSLLEILPATDNTGKIYIGNGTKDLDVRIFLGTAAAYVDFNVTAAALVISAGVQLDVDDTTASTNTTTGSIHTAGGLGVAGATYLGTILGMNSAASDLILIANTAAALEFYDATTKFFVADTRTTVANSMLTATAIPATIVAASGTTRRTFSIVPGTTTLTGSTGVADMSGVGLYISAPIITDSSAVTVAKASSVFIDGAATAGGSVSLTDALALCVFGKVAFGENGTGYDLSIYGDDAGNYFRWDQSNNSMMLVGPKTWFYMGTKADLLPGSGVAFRLVDDYGAFRIFTDDNGVNVPWNVRALQSRTLLTTSQSGGSIRAIQGQFKVATGVNFQSGVYAANQGYIELAGTHTVSAAGILACFDASIEIGTALTATGYVAGFKAELTGAGTCAAGLDAGFLVTNAAGAAVWTYGLYVEASAVDTGVYVGSCVTGINIEGTVTLALGIGTTAALTTAITAVNAVKVQSNFTGADSAYHIANYLTSSYTGTGTGSLRTVVGQVTYAGDQATVTTPAQYLVGIHGRAQVTGDVDNTVLCLTGVHAQILNGGAGTFTNANQVAALWVDWQEDASMAAVTTSALAILSNNSNSGTAANNPESVFYMYAPNVDILFHLAGATNGGMVAAASAGSANSVDTVKIKIKIDSATYYLLATTTPT